MKLIQAFILNIFHPLLIPLYGVVLTIILAPYYFGFWYEKQNISVIIMTFLNFSFFPAFVYFMMNKLELMNTSALNERQKMFIPYVYTMVFYIWGATVAFKTNISFLITTLLIGSCIALALSFFINIFNKVSIYAVAMGALVSYFILYAYYGTTEVSYYLIASIALAGIVGWADISKNKVGLVTYLSSIFLGCISIFFAFRFLDQ
jgi:hypothetical protein